jgi:hypothetical protein
MLILLPAIDYHNCPVCQNIRKNPNNGTAVCSKHMAILAQYNIIKEFEKKIYAKEPCKICHGVQRTRCMICGWRLMTGKELIAFDAVHLRQYPNSTKEFTNRQMARVEIDKWMKFLKNRVGKFNMPTTGDPVVDEQIKAYYGLWELPQ